DQAPGALLVQLGPVAVRAARREALRPALRIDALGDAVDPAEAERLLDSVAVRQARLAGARIVEDQPDRPLGRVVCAGPRPPFGALGDVERRRHVHRWHGP